MHHPELVSLYEPLLRSVDGNKCINWPRFCGILPISTLSVCVCVCK
jgi:hypothetical protein